MSAHGDPFVETAPGVRSRSHVGWNDWKLMAALLRKAGYAVTGPAAAQEPWMAMPDAPRSQRVLVSLACGVIEIACLWNGPEGWLWVSDDGDRYDEEDPVIGWMPLPPAALRPRSACPCTCHRPDGRVHELPCCRPAAGTTRRGVSPDGP